MSMLWIILPEHATQDEKIIVSVMIMAAFGLAWLFSELSIQSSQGRHFSFRKQMKKLQCNKVWTGGPCVCSLCRKNNPHRPAPSGSVGDNTNEQR